MKPVVGLMVGFVAGVVATVAVVWILAAQEAQRSVSTDRQRPQDAPAARPPHDEPSVSMRDAIAPAPASDAPISLGVAAASAAPWAGESLGIVVYGTVRDANGKSDFDDMAQVELVPATGPSLWASIDGGTYSRAGLSTGSWHVETHLSHFKPSSQALELTGKDAFVRLDIVLSASHSVIVRAFTPDGRPLQQALVDEVPHGDALAAVLGAVASAEPLTEAPLLRSFEWSHWGIGRFWMHGSFGAGIGRVSMPDDCLGLLELEVASPVFVHLMLGSCLLGSRPVGPDESEVSFTVSVTDAGQCAGSVSARCLDAATRSPVTDASISFTTQDAFRGYDKPDAEGRWHIEPVTPGEYRFTAFGKATEHVVYRVVVQPGQAVDLGDILLHEALTISGVVVDAEGHPVSTSLRLSCLDVEGPFTVEAENSYNQTDADGAFEFRDVGARRYVVSVVDDDLARHPVLVSTLGGSVSGLRIVAEKGLAVTFQPGWPAAVTHTVQVRDEAGLLTTQVEFCRGNDPWTRRLMPGPYTAIVLESGKELRRVEFVVAGDDSRVNLGS